MKTSPSSMQGSERVWARLRQDRLFLVMLVIVGSLAVAAVVGPFLTGYDFGAMSERQFSAPSAEHWCGTDVHGRDLLTRMLHGARISLLVGVIGASVSLVIGVAYGAVAGYCGGKTDLVMMRAVDVLYSLPRLIFVIILITALERPVTRALAMLQLSMMTPHARLLLLFMGLGMVEWLTMARIVRGQVLTLKEQAFVQAARALGQRHIVILWKHLLPNLSGIIIVYLTLTIPVVILEESFLSFLGLGVQAPAASWGTLIADGAQVINPLKVYWWLLVFPASLMALTLLALNFLGDSLRDVLDPRRSR
jgi:oligopeptide transport system permease protein